VDPAGNSAASGSMRDVAVLSSSQMKSIQGLVGNTLEQSVLSTVELQRMKDTASGEIERREAAAKQASQAAKAEQLEKVGRIIYIYIYILGRAAEPPAPPARPPARTLPSPRPPRLSSAVAISAGAPGAARRHEPPPAATRSPLPPRPRPPPPT